MKLGLIGTGKQGQRYLLEKNGGRHIVRSGSREIDYEGLDGVIIATHPAGHKELALECIAAGKPVLVEKPLALTLRDCMDIIDAAEKAAVALDVAHIDLWSQTGKMHGKGDVRDPVAVITYANHDRDYSPWLDWAPHGLAMLADMMPNWDTRTLRLSVALSKGETNQVGIASWYQRTPEPKGYAWPTPMWLMLRDFMLGRTHSYDFNRRVYRALFAEEP